MYLCLLLQIKTSESKLQRAFNLTQLLRMFSVGLRKQDDSLISVAMTIIYSLFPSLSEFEEASSTL